MISKMEFFHNSCNLQTRRWCAKENKMEYECLSEKSGQIWCCKNFKKNMFSFFDLNDLKSILNDFKNFDLKLN